VDERLAGARAGWQLAGGGHLQALDDGLAMAGRGIRGGEERQGRAGRMGASRGELGTPPRDPGCPGVHRSTYRLSRAVAPDDEGQGLGEYDGVVVIGAEAADALYEHLVDGAHDGVAAGLSNPIEKTRGANEGRTRSPRRGRLSVRAGEATGGAIRAGE